MAELEQLLEAAKKIKMTNSQREEQRESFAYGNAKIENDLITRDTVKKQAELLKEKENGK